jgi:hypothetical protein
MENDRRHCQIRLDGPQHLPTPHAEEVPFEVEPLPLDQVSATKQYWRYIRTGWGWVGRSVSLA